MSNSKKIRSKRRYRKQRNRKQRHQPVGLTADIETADFVSIERRALGHHWGDHHVAVVGAGVDIASFDLCGIAAGAVVSGGDFFYGSPTGRLPVDHIGMRDLIETMNRTIRKQGAE